MLEVARETIASSGLRSPEIHPLHPPTIFTMDPSYLLKIREESGIFARNNVQHFVQQNVQRASAHARFFDEAKWHVARGTLRVASRRSLRISIAVAS
jgi:hypothetical protein